MADANGEISTQIQSLGNLRTASPLDWFIDARVYWKQQQDLVDVNAEGGFVKFMASGMAGGLANVMAELFWDEGDDSIASITTDFATSVLVIGDVRDILRYGGEWYFGLADPAAKVTVTFAGFGLLTTVTPALDYVVAAAKITLKKAINTKAAQAIADLAWKIKDELIRFNTATIDKFSNWFSWCANSSQCDDVLSRGIAEFKDLDNSRILADLYGDSYNLLVTKIYNSFDDLGQVAAEKLAKEVSEALARAAQKTGQKITGNALDGMIKAARSMKGLRGTLNNLVERFGGSHTELDEILKLANKYYDTPGAPGNISRLGGSIGGSIGGGDNGAQAVRFTMRHFARENTVNVAFEVPQQVLVLGKPFKIRRPDGIKDGVVFIESKNWTSGNLQFTKQSNITEIFESGGTVPQGEYVEWMADIILKGPSFDNLTWLVHKNAQPKAALLKQKMLEVFDDPLIVKFLKRENKMSNQAIENLKNEFSNQTFDKVVKFVDDTPVVLP